MPTSEPQESALPSAGGRGSQVMMAETAANRPSSRWSKKLKIPRFRVAVFRGVANHILPLVRRSIGYSQLTGG